MVKFWIRCINVRVGSHGVPSPNHGDKPPTFEPPETIQIWLIINKVGS